MKQEQHGRKISPKVKEVISTAARRSAAIGARPYRNRAPVAGTDTRWWRTGDQRRHSAWKWYRRSAQNREDAIKDKTSCQPFNSGSLPPTKQAEKHWRSRCWKPNWRVIPSEPNTWCSPSSKKRQYCHTDIGTIWRGLRCIPPGTRLCRSSGYAGPERYSSHQSAWRWGFEEEEKGERGIQSCRETNR